MYAESYKSRKKRNYKKLLLVPLLAIFGIGLYLHGEGLYSRVYLQLFGENILRLMERSDRFLTALSSGDSNREELFQRVIEDRRLLSIHRRDNRLNADILYFEAVFDLYEVILRTDLSPDSALKLSGRGYLPGRAKDTEELPPENIEQLSLAMTEKMRRLLAVHPDYREKDTILLSLTLGDLLYTGRTDENLIELLDSVDRDNIKPELQHVYDWVALSLYSLKGIPGKVQATLDQITDDSFDIDENSRNLFRAFAYFENRNYLQALQAVRRVKFNADASPEFRAEAARMEGEIFLIQSGPGAARHFFHEANRFVEGQDRFIQQRLESLPPPPRIAPVQQPQPGTENDQTGENS